mmetsp:Transcript_57871/g.103926  ORF Transcript_57871/g.103926 Transcript_57871/m.103926 type:complete len:91 (-) Transcript_57871:271-543(-)
MVPSSLGSSMTCRKSRKDGPIFPVSSCLCPCLKALKDVALYALILLIIDVVVVDFRKLIFKNDVEMALASDIVRIEYRAAGISDLSDSDL